MTEKIAKPHLRFAGFDDTWEQRKLGDMAKYRNGKAHENDISEQGKFIVVNSKFVSTNGEVRKFSNKQIEPLFKNEIAFVLSDVPNGRAIARTFLVDKNDKYTLNQRIAGITPIEGVCPYFLHILMNRNKYFLQFDDGAKQTNLSVNDVIEFAEYYPSSEEQQQIGSYFRNLDHLITLHQRKYDKLTNVKKSMLEKMFPKNGSNVPEIRFKGFSDAWEQRKFSDITFPAGEKNRDNLPLESYSITNEHGFVPQDEKFENGGTMREADKRMYYIVSPNSFAYNPARINVGSIGYQNIGKNVIVSSLYEVFKTSEDVDDRLLWHWFKSPDFQKLIMQLQEGGVRLYFYYDKLCMGEVSLPSLEEQRKIGKLFDTLDNLITLHQRELEKLKNLKKACLEKMFV